MIGIFVGAVGCLESLEECFQRLSFSVVSLLTYSVADSFLCCCFAHVKRAPNIVQAFSGIQQLSVKQPVFFPFKEPKLAAYTRLVVYLVKNV